MDIFKSKGAKKAEEYEKQEPSSKKKILWHKFTRDGSTIEVTYEENDQIKRMFLAPGTEGKSGSATVLGSGGSGGYTRTKLYAYTEDDIKKEIANQLGIKPEELPSFEEIKGPSRISYFHEKIDEIANNLLKKYESSTQIPANEYLDSYAEMETILEFDSELRDSMRFLEPFKEIYYDILHNDKDIIELIGLRKAVEAKERYYRNLKQFESVLEEK